MKPLLSFFLLCMAFLAAPAQNSRTPNTIPPGSIAFFTSAENGHMASSMGASSTFSGFDDVYALVVPPFDMEKLPPGNAYLVEVWMDGIKRGVVQIALPPAGPMDDAIPFPLYPNHGDDHYPQLIGLMDMLLDAPMHQRVAHSFYIRVALAESELYLAEGRFQTDDNFYGGRLKEDRKVVLAPLPSPQPCDAETMDFLVVRLRLQYMDLTLHKAELLADWQAETEGGKLFKCQVRYVAQDKAGRCYEGISELRRYKKKTGEMGVIVGSLWPNRLVGCE
jgi:hypothetical protein